MISNIFKYIQLAMAGVIVVEQTFSQDAGASKKQKAIDLITNEAQLVGLAFPDQAAFTSSIINIAVASFNLVGLFQHKSGITGVK